MRSGNWVNQSHLSDMPGAPGDGRTGGILSSIDHSQAAHDLLAGGDIRIPGLGSGGPNGALSGAAREDSFEIACKSVEGDRLENHLRLIDDCGMMDTVH